MFLAIDLGNTNIVIGVFQGERLKANWCVSTEKGKTVDEYGVLLKNLLYSKGINDREIKKIAISCVVPSLIISFKKIAEKYFAVKPLIVNSEIKVGISIKCAHPEEIGADRLVNAVAAYNIYKKAVVVVDFGTATTFDVISEEGEYLGGVIAPGIKISAEALFEKAAKLFPVGLVKPKKVVGKNTVNSVQSGIIYGVIGQVEGIIARIREELNKDFMVVATGGLAELIARETKVIDKIDPFLTLKGLRIIYKQNERNKG